MTTKEQFQLWKEQGYNWIPVINEVMGDLETPLTIYLKLANTAYTCLLEFGYNGEHLGRYSFIGLKASTRLLVKQNQVLYFKQDTLTLDKQFDDPLKEIENIINTYRVPSLVNYPRFMGGFIGYFGYDTIRYFESRLKNFKRKDILQIPDIFLMLPDAFVVYDNLYNKIFIVVYVAPDVLNAYENALDRIFTIQQALKNPLILDANVELQDTSNNSNDLKEDWKSSLAQFSSHLTKEVYEEGVQKAVEYFRAGDAMQLILSQRFSKSFDESALALYRVLRQLNPSPYMFYLHLDDMHIVGASPELLVRKENNIVTVRPLAGTRKRGKTLDEDRKFEKELLSDTKEIAEHLMLIDLGRNDLGKVCELGSVQVSEQMVIERFSHVMHLSSTVTGKVKSGISSLDILRATFPAGTVSGAPKIRAIEIIDELETEKRGIYGGAIGYLGWNGNMDMAIALRTALIKNKTIYIQAGAGLVVDSVPSLEWHECINKAKALFQACKQLAEQRR